MLSADHGKPPFLPGLGGLRAAAVLAVLIGHAAAWITPLPQSPDLYAPLARLTQCGLSAFFVLSGFVLQYNYGARLGRGRRELVRFAAARLARVYPVYAVLLAVALAGIFIRIKAPGAVTGFGQSVLACLTLTQCWFFFPESPSIFPLAWAVSTEVFFYLLFPVLTRLMAAAVSRRGAFGLALAGVGAAVGLDLLVAGHWPQLFAWVQARHPAMADSPELLAGLLFEWLTYVSPYFRIFEFIGGMAVARLFILGARPPVWLAGAAAGLLVAALAIPVPNEWFFFAILKNNILYAPALATLCLCLAARPPALASRPLVSRIGAGSLSIYLVQPWALKPLKALAHAAPGLWLVVAPAGMAATVVAGLLLARYMEAPLARRLLAWTKPKA